MKAIIEYDLNDESDRRDYELANMSLGMMITLDDMRDKFRHLLKYANLADDRYDEIEKLSDYFYESLNDNNIKLD